jgi:hypothetical protein
MRKPSSVWPLELLCLLSLGGPLGGCAFNPKGQSSSGTGGAGPAAAGGSGAPGAGGTSVQPAITNLKIDPPTASLTVTAGGAPATQQLRVTGTVNGATQDLTSTAAYSVSPAGGVTVDAHGLATATAGGQVTVTATAGGASAQATLLVKTTFVGPDPGAAGKGVPADAQAIVAGAPADPSRAPQLVYPNDGVLFPPNVSGVELHFVPGKGNTLFQVELAGPLAAVTTFVRCTAPAGIDGCIYLPDAALWSSRGGANAGPGPVTVKVTGTDDSGTAAGTSAPIALRFAKDPIQGALYYWTTSGKTAIVRWDFGGGAAAATPYLTPSNTDGKTCVGCHALAPNGDKLVASAGGENDGRLLLWNVGADKPMQPFPLAQKSQFESWNADGTQFVGVYGDDLPNHAGPVNLTLFDGATGAVTSTIDLGGLRADHPDWSKNAGGPDTIVFTAADPQASTPDQQPATGAIDYVRKNGGAWGPPQTLVPAQLGKNRYYPAISPDGNLVVYDESTCTKGTPKAGQTPDTSCNGDVDPTATMFVTSLAGGAPIALAHANSPGVADQGTTALTNSFPRWAPFVERLDEMHQLVWLTFSSTRQYGLRAPPPSTAPDEAVSSTLIWMVGVNQDAGGGDPSFAAFCLPFQDVTTSNHIAQWAKYFIQGPG